MRAWERRAAEYRLQQMRAHQLRMDLLNVPVPERKPRVLFRHYADISGFQLWTTLSERQQLYEAALNG